MRIQFTLATIIMAIFACHVSAVCAQTLRQPVNALVLAGSIFADLKIDPKLARQLDAEGIHVVVKKLADPLSPEMLRQFHLVIIADWEGPKVSYFMPDFVKSDANTRRNIALLQQYIQEGGGFFFTPTVGGNLGADAQSTFLETYGAQVYGMQVRDDAHAFVTPYGPERYPDEYVWTTAITNHPVTAGVQRLFYPTTQLRWDDMYATPVMTFSDPAWTVLVRGMESSTAAKCMHYTEWIPQEVPKQPAIAAVREYGKGRIGAFSPAVQFTLWMPYADPSGGTALEMHTGKIAGILLEKGNGALKSDGRTLLVNMFRWLAEPARAAGMGNYAQDRFAALPVPASEPVPDWVFSWRPNNGAHWFKMLVGARSAYSTGSGTVAEYAAAARKAGVSVLVFAETFEKFNPREWEQFREDCRAASDGSLAVFPGLDIPDTYGSRYLLLNSPLFPPPQQLTADGKAMAKVEFLCFTYPKGITVAHRVTSSPIPDQLLKHFQGISLYTYRKGALEDNSLLTYQWQLFRYSNPIPFIVHEMDAPAQVEREAGTGQQMYAAADSLPGLLSYIGEQGMSHYFESPMHFQVSDGPRITALGGAPFIAAECDAPITEVLLYENYNLYRRWMPNTTTFFVDQVKLPVGHVSWAYAVVRDAKGRTAISPGMKCGREMRYTSRCPDRQNWFTYPNLYTGTLVEHFDIHVPTFGADEGRGFFPEMFGPQRGDDMTAILDFAYASPAMYVQDVYLDERYYRATYAQTGYDGTPAQAATRSRVYEGKLRYSQFFIPDGGKQDPANVLPLLEEVTISLRMPVEPSGSVFPIFTRLNFKREQKTTDMSYAYTDPATGKPVTGTLTEGYLDLPKGGRIGDLIALSEGIRVSADGLVGFAPPAVRNGALPAGTNWHALFTTVKPEEAESWRSRMGLTTKTPYTISTSQGKVSDLAYVANCQADRYGLAGTVTTPLGTSYLLPVKLSGINYNWAAGVWREGSAPARVEVNAPAPVAVKPSSDEPQLELPAFLIRQTPVVNTTATPLDKNPEEIGVFEGNAWARLDVGQPGGFYVGNLVLATEPSLRLDIIRWTADELVLDVNNPTEKAVTATIWTAPGIRNCLQGKTTLTLPAGASQIVALSGRADPAPGSAKQR